jgi:hypothetical protein
MSLIELSATTPEAEVVLRHLLRAVEYRREAESEADPDRRLALLDSAAAEERRALLVDELEGAQPRAQTYDRDPRGDA